MAELFLSEFVSIVVEKLASVVLEELFLAWGLKTDLKEIKQSLNTIKAVLYDAEHRSSRNQGIQLWLSDLNQVLHDIEDVVHEFECEALRRQVVKTDGTTGRKLRRFFSSANPLAFRFRMAHKIKDIKSTIRKIAKRKAEFGLLERISDTPVANHQEREMTHSFVDAASVIGRENDKEDVIRRLLDVDTDKTLSVLPIVGMGGLGKTALVKLVYNDHWVVSHFDLRLWVCVSDGFDLQKVIIKILTSAEDDRHTNLEMDQLQKRLRRTLNGRKYLLILDAVWNNDPMKWRELIFLLKCGAGGSKIVVTTRGMDVASIMGTMDAYELSVLPHSHCLTLFSSCAFKEGQERRYPNLLRIGDEIVKKCKGVPLAVITLGTLLFSVTDEAQWRSVRDNEIWKSSLHREDGILPVLKLSYDSLPYYLKRCFAYCSIFPKDYVFDDIELVYFWMALGLIESENGDKKLEDVGFSYLRELCSRCFFQDFSELHGNVRFRMHDLMHDLALSVSKDEFSTVNFSSENISKNVRHLSFPGHESLPINFPASLQTLRSVRTVSFQNETRDGFISKRFLRTCLSSFEYLRVLNLACSKFEVLPKRIGKLKHMQYLSLVGNRYIKELPASLCKLQSLQTLLLWGCDQLHELPRNLKCMISLRFLWITSLQWDLATDGIGCLKSLRYLFITDCMNLKYLLNDMQGLTNLRSLIIARCNRLISLPPSMKYLPALETLFIANCENLNLATEDVRDSSRFNLHKLHIEGLPKLKSFPHWLLPRSACRLQVLEIVNCYYLRELPENVSGIISLQKCVITGCPRL